VLHDSDKLGRGIQLSVHPLLFIDPVSNTEMEEAVRKMKQSLKKISEMLKYVGNHYDVGQYFKQGSLFGARLERKEKHITHYCKGIGGTGRPLTDCNFGLSFRSSCLFPTLYSVRTFSINSCQ